MAHLPVGNPQWALIPSGHYSLEHTLNFPLVVIDAPMLVFQSFYAIPDTFRDGRGRPVNAVLGFTQRLLDILASVKAARTVLCWDESLGTGFRHRLFAPYKANRPLADENFRFQLQCCAEITDALGLSQLASQEFEADDIVASLVHWQRQDRRDNRSALIVSQDKDLAQLVQESDQWWPFPKSGPWSYAQLIEHWQIPLASIADYQALCGDAVDNIPGVKGIGAVGARVLIQAFFTLETLFHHLDDVADLPVRGARGLRQKLEIQRDDAFMFRELTRLRNDAVTATGWQQLENQPLEKCRPDGEALKRVLQQVQLWPRLQKRVERHFQACNKH